MITIDELFELDQYAQVRDIHKMAAIAARRIRRVELGPFLSVAFENRELLWYQIHEMLHSEKLSTQSARLNELATYNALLPDSATLSATLFIELTEDDSAAHWLNTLVGIERHLVLTGPDGQVNRSVPEVGHASALTRTDATSAVHYLRLPLTSGRLSYGSTLGVDHPGHQVQVALADPLVDALNRELET